MKINNSIIFTFIKQPASPLFKRLKMKIINSFTFRKSAGFAHGETFVSHAEQKKKKILHTLGGGNYLHLFLRLERGAADGS
jgi:hypothetical protein